MTNITIVADSSPLIALAVIKQLTLLPQLYTHILIPPAVWEEVTIQGIGLPGALEVSQATWLSIQSPPSQLASSLQLLIDKKESAITTSNHLLKLDVQVLIVKIPPRLRASGVQ